MFSSDGGWAGKLEVQREWDHGVPYRPHSGPDILSEAVLQRCASHEMQNLMPLVRHTV